MMELLFAHVRETIADLERLRAHRSNEEEALPESEETRSVYLGDEEVVPNGANEEEFRLARIRLLTRVALTALMVAWIAFVFTSENPSDWHVDSANMAFGAVLGYWFS